MFYESQSAKRAASVVAGAFIEDNGGGTASAFVYFPETQSVRFAI